MCRRDKVFDGVGETGPLSQNTTWRRPDASQIRIMLMFLLHFLGFLAAIFRGKRAAQ